MSFSKIAGFVGALAVAAGFLSSAGAAELSAQKSAQRGVTVAITPQNIGPNAPAWEFKVVLDTHSQDLSDDMMKSAVLLDPTGRQHAPVAWKGAPPGGHHREGVLSFAPIKPAPASVELRIQRPGEAQPRSFRWEL
jgi:hypothetical protein